MPEEHLEPVLLIECPRMLFPFARRIISDATAEGGFPPFLLEPIDFSVVYAAQRAERERLASGETQGNAPGTKWAAVNAIVEHADWIRPVNQGSQRFARAIDDSARKTRALSLVAGA